MEIDVVLFGIERSEVVDVTCMDSCRASQHSFGLGRLSLQTHTLREGKQSTCLGRASSFEVPIHYEARQLDKTHSCHELVS